LLYGIGLIIFLVGIIWSFCSIENWKSR